MILNKIKGVGAKPVVLSFITQWFKREEEWVDLEQVLITNYRVAKRANVLLDTSVTLI
jgi:hypothetical protein